MRSVHRPYTWATIIFVVSLCLPGIAVPQEPPPSQHDRETKCVVFGEGAADIARSRDQGIPLSTIIRMIRESFPDEPTLEKYFRLLSVEIYEKPWWTPVDIQRFVEADCDRRTLDKSQRQPR